jgi:glycosyltransferase involved in cell wall biosynthesis
MATSDAAIDIGLPVYNGANFLSEAIESLLGQADDDFTLWISDNGSTDATPSIIAEWSAADARIRSLRSEVNRGAAWNFNRCFGAGTAPYFMWAAHDDLRDATFLKKARAVLDADDGVVSCFAMTEFVDDDGQSIPPPDAVPDAARMEDRPHLRLGALLGAFPMHIIFGLMRRDALARTRGWGSFSSADRVLTSEIALQGRIARIDEPLFIRRFHDDMSWHPDIDENDYARWYDPDAPKRLLPVVRRGYEYAAGVRHARLGRRDELACLAAVGRYASWDHGVVRLRRYGAKATRVLRPSVA